MEVSHLMWVEKYRPFKLSSVVNQKSIVDAVKNLIKNPEEMPNLMFSGPSGVGKTTVALCVARELLGDYWKDYTLELNASDERGINMVRERVKMFARYSGMTGKIPFKVIILDEADEMTGDAQTALRRIIEDSAKSTRFMLICNYLSQIIEPIQSRCVIFRFTNLPEEDVVSHLETICKQEKVKYDEKALSLIYEFTEGDLRHAINVLQAAASMGSVNTANANVAVGISEKGRVGEIVKLALSGKFQDARTKLIELTKVYGMSERDFLRFANEEVQKLKTSSAEVISALAECDYRLVSGAHPDIQLAALLAELGKIGKEIGFKEK
ncbi:MAG TPA: replication factor C small subunit [Nitrososphaerales archaeon]|nr:replication factor C small subunit [Nitrososphaerales archaeon]